MIDRNWQKVWLGLGGNVGDVVANMQNAIQLFVEAENIRVTCASKVYKTPPWGKTDQDWFFNAALEIETSLSPEDVLSLCLKIETVLHRVRTERWGPRTIDIDILAMEQGEVSSQNLTIPHPRLIERAFALIPLAELNSDLMVEGKSVRDWCELIDAGGIEQTNHRLKVN